MVRNESNLSCSVVASSTKDSSDGFVGHAILSGNQAQGVVVFNDTAYHVRPFFRSDAIVRRTWPWILLCGGDRGKTAKHLLEYKESLVELTMGSNKMD